MTGDTAQAVIERVKELHAPVNIGVGTVEMIRVLLQAGLERGELLDRRLRSGGHHLSLSRSRLAKKKLPSPIYWKVLGRALDIAELLRESPRERGCVVDVARNLDYDPANIRHLFRRAFGMTASQIRSANDLQPLVDAWYSRQVAQ